MLFRPRFAMTSRPSVRLSINLQVFLSLPLVYRCTLIIYSCEFFLKMILLVIRLRSSLAKKHRSAPMGSSQGFIQPPRIGVENFPKTKLLLPWRRTINSPSRESICFDEQVTRLLHANLLLQHEQRASYY